MSTPKIALVTGAAGVLGKAIAKSLAEEGMRIVVADIAQEPLNAVSQELPGDTYPIAFDISDPKQVDAAMEKVMKEVGEIDVLVNSAGILSNNKAETTTPEEWQRVMQVNLNGAFYLSRAVLPAMKKKRWGRIVNITSLASKTGGITAGTAYSTSKGAMNSLTFSLAAETAPYGITANGIAPAYIKTPMVTEQLTEEQRQELLKKIPVGRFCEAEECAHTVKFLVSPLAGFITGEIIDQNGGLMFD
ncbi:3-oxoacyl-ACP reductase [candidate division KSB3 bacterium]|uniref:3-oxoacyl-ACP reductase n=1 Tax=candidate division KSB3 bacterium TaxID=2044937 RepID=A0A2G6KNC2_9BACT|nr:MAG: 3-oxoacyl-ACP reductase [candidate division KSB3 bacterium]